MLLKSVLNHVSSSTASHSGPEAAEWPQTITPAPPCLRAGVLFMKCCGSFVADVTDVTFSVEGTKQLHHMDMKTVSL